MKLELVTHRQNIAALAGRWDELAREDARDGFFRTSGWYLSWLDHVRPDAQPFVVVARDSEGNIAGLAPLCRVRHREHWLPMDGVSLGGREVVSGEYLDYLSVPHARTEVLCGVMEFLWKEASRWDLLITGEVFAGGDLHRALESFAERKGLAIRVQEERVCPFIELPPTFEQYLAAGFNQKRRKEIKRQTRVILEDFGAQIEVYSRPEEIAENLDSLVQLHTGRWQSANQTGNMGRPGFVRFLYHICDAPPAGALPRLYVMKHQGQPVAALLVFYFGQSALAYSIGRDPGCAISHLSPGFAILVRSIQDAIQQGYRYYDFLRGDERFKFHLTKSVRKTITILVGRSPSARAYLQALALKDTLKQRFPRLWARLAGADAGPNPAGKEEVAGAPAAARPDTESHATV
jgi:CelD/BcsL family acetyltransferase involved in cellulose biosynthesis